METSLKIGRVPLLELLTRNAGIVLKFAQGLELVERNNVPEIFCLEILKCL